MTTVLDIIDTAVKIGLGATISGVTTYFVLTRNHKQENKLNFINTKKELLKECLLNIEEGLTVFSHARDSIIFERNNGGHENTNISIENLKELNNIVNSLKDAKAIAYLISEKELATSLTLFADEMNELVVHFKNRNTAFDSEFTTEKIKELRELKSKINNQFGEAFESVHS